MNSVIKKIGIVWLVLQSTYSLAGTGNLFNVTSSGAALGKTVSYTLCLNIKGKTPLSCQNYSTSQANLSIHTTVPHRTYYDGGIKIITSGYVYIRSGLRRSSSKRGISAAEGYVSIGPVSDTQAATGTITSTTPIPPTPPTLTYTNIYVETRNSLVTYSADNETSWGTMLSPQSGWYWDHTTWATATTTDGTMYQATGIQGDGTPGNSTTTLIYSQDGIHWTQVASFPGDNNWVQSVFAVGNTVYVGTGSGYVYYTSDHGISWQPNTPAQVPDATRVNAVVVDGNGIFYAGTNNGNIYSSSNSGTSWALLSNQPSGSGGILSLAIDSNGALYAVKTTTTTQPQYNTAPLTTGTWQLMTALPAGDGNAQTIAATGTTVYVGTSNSHVMYTSNLGQSWAGNQVPNDTSGITSLFVTQSTLSPLFVESYGVIQLTTGQGMGTITVKNLSSSTVNNVQADSTQLPLNVTQTSTPCTSVAPGNTCSITFAANGTNGFAPTAFNIVDDNKNIISRSALVSSITPNGGTDYYYVYNVNGTIASIIDAADVSNGVYWGFDGSTFDYTSIWGVAENSTTTVPYPNATQPSGETATYYTNQQNCNGATDGSCNAGNIYIYYHDILGVNTSTYATGLCYADTSGGAAGTGEWYLPSSCELNGGMYLNVTTNQLISCTPVVTGFLSLHSLGALGGPLNSLINGTYWSSTEYSTDPTFEAWIQIFNSGGVPTGDDKTAQDHVRCSQALTI